jgi:hypothetical protein
MPNLIHDVSLKGRGDYIERGEHKVGQEEGCVACMLVANVLMKHILRMLLLAQMTFANNRHQKMHILQDLIVLPTLHANEMHPAMHSTWQCGADERACQPVDG